MRPSGVGMPTCFVFCACRHAGYSNQVQQRPPAGHVGYWTDGANELYLGALTHSGTLFFCEYEIRSDIVTTNILDWLSGQDDP